MDDDVDSVWQPRYFICQNLKKKKNAHFIYTANNNCTHSLKTLGKKCISISRGERAERVCVMDEDKERRINRTIVKKKQVNTELG